MRAIYTLRQILTCTTFRAPGVLPYRTGAYFFSLPFPIDSYKKDEINRKGDLVWPEHLLCQTVSIRFRTPDLAACLPPLPALAVSATGVDDHHAERQNKTQQRQEHRVPGIDQSDGPSYHGGEQQGGE